MRPALGAQLAASSVGRLGRDVLSGTDVADRDPSSSGRRRRAAVLAVAALAAAAGTALGARALVSPAALVRSAPTAGTFLDGAGGGLFHQAGGAAADGAPGPGAGADDGGQGTTAEAGGSAGSGTDDAGDAGRAAGAGASGEHGTTAATDAADPSYGSSASGRAAGTDAAPGGTGTDAVRPGTAGGPVADHATIVATLPSGATLSYTAPAVVGERVVAAAARPVAGRATDVLVVLERGGRPVLRHDVVRAEQVRSSEVLASPYQPSDAPTSAATPVWLPDGAAFVLADRAAWGPVLRVVGWQGGAGTDDLATDVVLLDLPGDLGATARVTGVRATTDGADVTVAAPDGRALVVDLHQRADGSWVDRASLHPDDPARQR